jgi:hypothetical protein
MAYYENWESVWTFRTERFAIIAEAAPEFESPHGSFDDDGQSVKDIESGRVQWFQARVRVALLDDDGEELETLGEDYLGGCAYEDPSDLFRDHARQTRLLAYHRKYFHIRLEQARNATSPRVKAALLLGVAEERKAMASILAQFAAQKRGVLTCYDGPDMVRQAIKAARREIARRKVQLISLSDIKTL